MTFECTLNVTGTNPQTSIQAFLKSYQDTSNPKYYKKYDKHLEAYFKDKLRKSISQAQIKDKNLDKSFFVTFKSEGIYFSSKSKKALKYEFGYGNNPPKRYLQPAIVETANEVSNIMITDALNLYNKYSRIL